MAPTRVNLVLIGLRGSGKSTLGRALAAALGRRLIDLDDITPGLLAMPDAATALRTLGETPFRLAEFQALKESLLAPDQVLALGGGTPTAPGAAALLRRERDAGRARVLYLAAPPQTLADRLARTDLDNRPSLTGKGVLEEITDLHAARDPLYRDLADLTLESTTDADADAESVLAWFDALA
ncbi:MAG: shikimate kinase [Phycisphaerales bacterium JB037]